MQAPNGGGDLQWGVDALHEGRFEADVEGVAGPLELAGEIAISLGAGARDDGDPYRDHRQR